MIDTIRIRIRDNHLLKSLKEKQAEQENIKGYIDISKLKQRIETGEVVEICKEENDLITTLYNRGIDINFVDYFMLQGLGSWNRDIFISLDTLNDTVTIEFSLNKFVQGNNVLSIENDLLHLYDFLTLLYKECSLTFNKEKFNDIELMRLDLAYNYKFQYDVISAVSSIFKNKNRHKRKKVFFYDTSLMLVGSSYSVKIYDKEEEFKKHDKKELLRRLDNDVKYKLGYKAYELDDLIGYLEKLSKGMVRVEVTIRKKKLEYDKIITIKDLLSVDLDVYYEYFLDLMGVLRMERVKLNEMFEKIDDRNDLEFLAFCSTFGTEKAKMKYAKRTFYYKKKRLKEKYGIDVDTINTEKNVIDFSTKSKFLVKVA